MSDQPTNPISGYDDLNADQVISALDSLDVEQLAVVRDLEQAEGGKDRKTVLAAINDRINKLEDELAAAASASDYPEPPEGRPPLGVLAEQRASGEQHAEVAVAGSDQDN